MRIRRIVILAVLLTLLLTLVGSGVQAQTTVSDDVLTEFDQLVRDEMEFFDIPGVAVAIIEGDEVIYAQGFGVRDLASGAPFTPETQFRIGSTTKSMTSMLVAQLVDEGVISWDTPVTDLFPDFETSNPELTAQLTVADLMGMGTGLVSDAFGSITWADWTIDTLLDAIGAMTIGGEYGELFSYNNEVYALAGYAATVADGLSPTLDNYKTLMQERIFDPIGMESAIITDDLTHLSDNYSESYETSLIDGEQTLMGNPPIALLAPAGAVWTNIDDMARYVITQMNGGVTPDGTRIVSEDSLAHTWQPGVVISAGELGIENIDYAMGWVTETYQGIPVRYHDGGWAGYRTQMMIMPEDDVALISFTNSANGDFFGSMLNYAFIEILHDLEPTIVENTHSAFADFSAQVQQAQGLISVDVGDLSVFTGAYEGGWTVEQRDGNSMWLTGHGWEFQIAYIAVIDQYAVINSGAGGTLLRFDSDGDAVNMVFIGDGEDLLSLAKID